MYMYIDEDIAKDKLELQKVTKLRVEKASELDIDFSLFCSLKELYIDSKKPYQISDSFSRLEQLETLSISGECRFPQTIHMPENLQEIGVHDKCILYPLPATTSLKALDISYYKKEIDPVPVPEWIFELTGLEKLCFIVCRFSAISDKISQLVNLKDLDFGCSLSDIHSFPDLSNLSQLKRLTVCGTAVQGQKLPPYSLLSQVLESIKSLSGLEYLGLQDWRPKRKAEWLVMKDKRKSIPDVFDNFPNLKELHLDGMDLDFVPESVFRLKNIKKLSLMGNKLSHDEIRRVIQHLPDCASDSDVMYYKPKHRQKPERV